MRHWPAELPGVEILLPRYDLRGAARPHRPDDPPAEITFTAPIAVNLGGLTCQIAPVGGDHAAGSSIVYVPEDGVVFLGDCLGSDIYHGSPNCTTGKLFPLLDQR